jgi:DNA invertase Pin-like site-specific DNA recombinase
MSVAGYAPVEMRMAQFVFGKRCMFENACMKIGYLWAHENRDAVPVMRESLRAAGCAKIFEDFGSEAGPNARAHLEQALAHVTTGDVLVVWELCALGGLADVARAAEQLVRVRASLRAIRDKIDTSTRDDAAFFRHVKVLSELRGRLHGKAIKVYYAAARRDGKTRGGNRPGRKRLLDAAQVSHARQEIEAGRASVRAMAKELDVGETTLRSALRRKDWNSAPGDVAV